MCVTQPERSEPEETVIAIFLWHTHTLYTQIVRKRSKGEKKDHFLIFKSQIHKESALFFYFQEI